MKLRVTVNGVAYDVDVEILEEKGGVVQRSPMAPAPAPAPARPVTPPPAAPAAPAPAASAPSAGARTLNSTIPGTVIEILVKPGQAVKAGEAVIVLDAMKMNTQIAATADGVVKAILVNIGDAVKMGQAMIEFE